MSYYDEEPERVPEDESAGSDHDFSAERADDLRANTPDKEESAASVGESDAGEDKLREADYENDKTADAKEKKESPALFLFDLLELIALSLAAVMLILSFLIRQSPVIGSSMYPTILGKREGADTEMTGKDVLLISDLFYTPEHGDIVVIQTPTLYSNRVADSMDHSIVKRVIAVGGDTMTIDFDSWRIEINGEVFEEGYGKASYVNYGNVKRSMDEGFMSSRDDLVSCTLSHEGSVYTLKIPEGMLFVMGDNRNNSMDSRRIGLIDERWIAGKAIVRIYPFDRIGTVD